MQARAALPALTTDIIDIDGAAIIAADLALLPAQINAAVHEAEGHAGQAVQAALSAGALLRQAKALVRHGEWENWLADNCTVAVRTAQAYMRLATKLPTLPAESAAAVALLPLREAVRAISTSPTAPPRVSTWLRPRDDKERAHSLLKDAQKALGDTARDIPFGRIKRAKIERARAKLQAAIELLDGMVADAEVPS